VEFGTKSAKFVLWEHIRQQLGQHFVPHVLQGSTRIVKGLIVSLIVYYADMGVTLMLLAPPFASNVKMPNTRQNSDLPRALIVQLGMPMIVELNVSNVYLDFSCNGIMKLVLVFVIRVIRELLALDLVALHVHSVMRVHIQY
jgi:hypothetical protein